MTKTKHRIDSYRPFIAFDSSRELKCVAHTLVVCGTSEEIIAVVKDLRSHEMDSNYDFITFDTEDYKRIGASRLAKNKKPYNFKCRQT